MTGYVGCSVLLSPKHDGCQEMSQALQLSNSYLQLRSEYLKERYVVGEIFLDFQGARNSNSEHTAAAMAE